MCVSESVCESVYESVYESERVCMKLSVRTHALHGRANTRHAERWQAERWQAKRWQADRWQADRWHARRRREEGEGGKGEGEGAHHIVGTLGPCLDLSGAHHQHAGGHYHPQHDLHVQHVQPLADAAARGRQASGRGRGGGGWRAEAGGEAGGEEKGHNE